MKDRFTEAVEELQEKSPFVCASCDHHDIPQGRSEMHDMHRDHLSEAFEESARKSAFVCESCRH